MKKFLAMLLTLCMVCSILPMSALAEEVLPEEEFLLTEGLPEIGEELIIEEEPAPEELLPEVLEEELLFTEELEEIEANEAGNTISSTVSGTGGYWADFEITFSVENKLKEGGYQLGIAFSAHAIELDEHGNGNCPVWNWDIPREDPDKAGGGTVVRRVDQLAPGVTYNYCAVIMDYDRNIIQREAVRQFTTPNDSTGFKTIVPNIGPVAVEGGRTPFSFFTSESGFFTLKGENIAGIDIQDANGEYVNGANRRWEDGPGSVQVTFFALADETLYISVFTPHEFTGSVTMEEAADLDKLAVGANKVHTDQPVSFTAPKAGWYSFTLDVGPSQGMECYEAQRADWIWCEGGIYYAKLAAGEPIILRGRYNEGSLGTRTLTVAEAVPPEKDSIVSAAAPAVIGSSEAEIEITVNITEATAATEGGYRYGILFSTSENFKDEAGNNRYREWSNSGHSIFRDAKFVERLSQLVPGVTYYYKGFVSDQDRNFFFTEETVHSFTASTDTSGITKLNFGQEAPVPRDRDSHYSFTAQRSGLFMVLAKGVQWTNVDDVQGNGLSGGNNPENSADFTIRCCFVAEEGETFYINAGNNISNSATIKVANVVGNADALTLGKAAAVHDNQVVTFTAPEAGTYRILTSNTGSNALHLFNDYTVDWDWCGSSTGPMVMDANQTVFLITWYDEAQEILTLTAEKIAFNPDPKNEEELRASLAVAAGDTGNTERTYTIILENDIAVTKDLVVPKNTELYIRADLTVASGVKLTNRSDICLNEGGTLTTAAGSSVVLEGIENVWWATILLQGGKIVNAGTLTVDNSSSVTLYCDQYDSTDAAIAAIANVDKKCVDIVLFPATQAEVDQGIASAGEYLFVGEYLRNGFFTVAGTIPSNMTFMLLKDSTVAVPADAAADVYGAFIMNGGTLANAGTLNMNKGSIIQWRGPSVCTNSGTLNLRSGSTLEISRMSLLKDAAVTNTGTVSRQQGITIDERINITGKVVDGETIPSDNIANFVLRCYTRGLNRDEASVRSNDAEGLAYWYNILTTRQLTPAQVGRYFAVSPESQMKYPGNGEFIAMLYRLYMEDRSYDQGGYDYWLNLLTTNTLSREQIIDYFGVSPEFQGIVASYGLG